jgi:hypothetical protein
MEITGSKENPDPPSVAKIGDLEIKFFNKYLPKPFKATIEIHRDGRKIQSYTTRIPYTHEVLSDSVFAADFNNDGLVDYKLIAKNTAITFVGNKYRKMYLIQQENGTFDIHYFMDFYREKERDLDGDGTWEVITRHAYYKNLIVYWVFDTFNFGNGAIVNTGSQFGYPRMTDNTDKLEDTKEFKKEDWHIYSRSVPDNYLYIPAEETY